MYSLIVSLALFGQSEFGVPPAPAAEISTTATPTTADEMRTWLLARLVIDSSFDEKKSAEAQRLLATMNTQQLAALVAAYKEKPVRPISSSVPRPPLDATQQQALDQAKLNQQQAEAYRDHLKREYDRRILQGQMTQNLVYQNIVNNQTMMFRGNCPFSYGAYNVGPFGYGGLSYGGFGYGMMNYGGWGYGAPMYGGGFHGASGAW